MSAASAAPLVTVELLAVGMTFLEIALDDVIFFRPVSVALRRIIVGPVKIGPAGPERHAATHHEPAAAGQPFHLDLYRLKNISSAKEVFFSEEEEAIQRQAILVIEWPELIESVINNFWKIKISYEKNYGRNYEIRDPKNLLTFS